VAAAVKLGAGNQQVLDSVDDAVKLVSGCFGLCCSAEYWLGITKSGLGVAPFLGSSLARKSCD
jgi:hypothetical protein